jgi:hypothetical protein
MVRFMGELVVVRWEERLEFARDRVAEQMRANDDTAGAAVSGGG